MRASLTWLAALALLVPCPATAAPSGSMFSGPTTPDPAVIFWNPAAMTMMEGTNALVRDSAAKLVMDFTDILEELNLTYLEQQIEMTALFPENEEEKNVLGHVTFDPTHIDEIVRTSGLPISTVSGVLAMMELKNMVRQVGGMNYVRLKETMAAYEAAT